MKKLFALVNPFVVLLARSFAHRLVSHQVVVLSLLVVAVADLIGFSEFCA